MKHVDFLANGILIWTEEALKKLQPSWAQQWQPDSLKMDTRSLQSK